MSNTATEKTKLKQSIPLKSIQNARDLGGYKTVDGRTIKHGLLLRTGKLDNISDSDIKALEQSYHLRHIIDFRMDMERVNAADPSIKGAEYHHLDVIDPSLFASAGLPEVDISGFDIVQMTKLSIQSGMLDERMYIGFLDSEYGRKAFSEFFRILISVEPDCAVLWHCTGGKDRTGLAAMLLLSALGVDEKTITEDYLLTNVYNAERIASTRQYLQTKGYEKAFIDKAVLVFDAVDESFLCTAINFLKKKYGSVTGYIHNGLKINQTEINSLKEKYLA